MEWLAWHAVNAPGLVNDALLAAYSDEVHRSLPDVVATLAVVAALQPEQYALLDPISEKLYILEGKIAVEAAACRLDADRSLRGLARLAAEATSFYKRLTTDMVGVLDQP